MLRLIEIPLRDIRWTAPDGLAPEAAFAALQPLLAELGPHHVALLSQPSVGVEAVAWDAPGSAQRALAVLSTKDREVLTRTLTTLLSDIRRAAETARAEGDNQRAELLDLVRTIPAQDAIFAVDGAPVLAGWGFATAAPRTAHPLAPFDDGIAPPPIAGDRPALLATAGALGALALAAVLAGPVLATLVRPPTPACVVDAEGLRLLHELQAMRDVGRDLSAARDALLRDYGTKQLDCPLPDPPPPPPPPTPPPPVAPPDATPCNAETRSGGAGTTRTRHFLGRTRGRVSIDYDNQQAPDWIRVYHRGRLIADTGTYVSGRGSLAFDWRPPTNGTAEDYVVEIEVEGGPNMPNTIWRYNMSCPAGR